MKKMILSITLLFTGLQLMGHTSVRLWGIREEGHGSVNRQDPTHNPEHSAATESELRTAHEDQRPGIASGDADAIREEPKKCGKRLDVDLD